VHIAMRSVHQGAEMSQSGRPSIYIYKCFYANVGMQEREAETADIHSYRGWPADQGCKVQRISGKQHFCDYASNTRDMCIRPLHSKSWHLFSVVEVL
jgi:hypothetical protein